MQFMANIFMSILIATTLLVNPLSTQKAYAQNVSGKCPPGKYWDNNLNRCLVSADTTANQVQALQCEGLTGDAYQQCFRNIVNSDLARGESDGSINNYEKSFINDNTANILVPLSVSAITAYYLFSTRKRYENCQNTSMWLIFSGGVVSLLGEFSAQTMLSTRTQKIEEDFKNSVSAYDESNKYEVLPQNPLIAFNSQIEGEKARKEAEKIRKGTYNLARILYGAAAITALLEMIPAGTAMGSACGVSTSMIDYSQKHYEKLNILSHEFRDYGHMTNLNSDELLEIIMRKIFSQIIPIAHAQEKPNQNEQTSVESFFQNKHSDLMSSELGQKQMGFIDKALSTTYIRAALASGLTYYADVLYQDAKDNVEIAKNRITFLEKMRDEWVAASGEGVFSRCAEDDYNNKEKPQCFCYLENGEPDQRKRKLSVCATVFAQIDYKKATNYDKTYGGKSGNHNVCINEKNMIDSFCKCRSQKSTAGKGNACLKVSSGFTLNGLGANSWLSGIVTPTDSLISGKISGSDLDSADFNNKAMKISKKLDEMKKDPKYKDAYAKIKDTQDKLLNANKAWFKKSFGSSVPRSLASALAVNSSLPQSAADVVKNAKEQMKGKNKDLSFTAAKDTATGPNQKNGMDFDWGTDSGSAGGVKIDDVAQVMDKNYEYKGDINNNPSQNIFQILSVRYQRSALRRLFDTAGKTQADEASDTDINQQ